MGSEFALALAFDEKDLPTTDGLVQGILDTIE